jgi:hypothetical protein
MLIKPPGEIDITFDSQCQAIPKRQSIVSRAINERDKLLPRTPQATSLKGLSRTETFAIDSFGPMHGKFLSVCSCSDRQTVQVVVTHAEK